MAVTTPVLNVSANTRQVQEILSVLDPGQYRKAIFQTIKRTTNSLKTIVADRIASVLNVKNKKHIRDAIFASVTSGDNPVGIVRIKHHNLSVLGFKGTRVSKKRGVTVHLRKDRGPQHFPHAFKATYKGRTDIWERVKGKDFEGRVAKSGRARRFPIRLISGVAVLNTLKEHSGTLTPLGTELSNEAQALLMKNALSQLARFQGQ